MDRFYPFVIYFLLALVTVRLLLNVKWKLLGKALFRNRTVTFLAIVALPVIALSVFLLDTPVRLLSESLHSHPLDTVIYWFNMIGDGAALYPLLLAFFFITLLFMKPEHNRFASRILLSVLLAGLVSLILKNIILRVRPYLTDDPSQFFVFIKEGIHFSLFNTGNNSFPSGHTTTAFAFWTPILLKIRKTWIRVICFVLPLMTGFSRIYLNRHWFTDVLAGTFIGLWVAFAVSQAMDKTDELKTE